MNLVKFRVEQEIKTVKPEGRKLKLILITTSDETDLEKLARTVSKLKQEIMRNDIWNLPLKDLLTFAEEKGIEYKVSITRNKKIEILLYIYPSKRYSSESVNSDTKVIAELSESINTHQIEEIFQKLPKNFRIDIAMKLYKMKKISFEKAKELSGLNTLNFLEETVKRKIPVEYGAEDLEEDLKTLEEIMV